jgi:hypothetical protein
MSSSRCALALFGRCGSPTLRDDAIGLDGIDDPPRREHRNPDHLADARSEMGIAAELECHVRNRRRLADVGLRGRGIDVEEIELAGRVDPLADLQHLMIVEPALGKVVSGHANADDEVRAHALAHRVDHAHSEAQAIVERAAVGVVSLVHVSRPELVDQVARARHDLAAVEPAGPKPTRGRGERLDELVDHRGLERMRIFAVIGLAHVARGVHAVPQVDAAAAAPPVRELADDGNIVLVHRVAELLEIRNHAIVEQLDAVPIPRRARGVDARGSEADHESDSAARLLFVVTALDVSGHAIDGERIRVRAAADPVLDAARPDLERREEILEFSHGPPPALPGSCL